MFGDEIMESKLQALLTLAALLQVGDKSVEYLI